METSPANEPAKPRRRHFQVHEVPEHFRELFIVSAYRHPNSTVWECLLSVFEANNETFNFWTHVLPSVYFTWWIYTVFRDDLHSYHAAYTLPFLVYGVSVCMFPIASALAHVFNTMSDRARHVCFFVDYAALSFYALGSAVAYRAYSFPAALQDTLFASVYLPVAAVISVLSMSLCSATRFMPNNILKKVLRMSSMACPYLFDVIPVVCRFVSGEERDMTPGIYPHMRQFYFSFLSVFFYVSHLPERIYPAYFDVIGHSHQLFHMMSVLGAWDQSRAFLLDLHDRRPAVPASPPEPDDVSFRALSSWVVILVGVINLIQLFVFSSQLYRFIPPTSFQTRSHVNGLHRDHNNGVVTCNHGNQSTGEATNNNTHAPSKCSKLN